MNGKFRPSAYPLITIDPLISVWSFGDRLQNEYTKHWTGRPAPISMVVTTGTDNYVLCGFDTDFVARPYNEKKIRQTSVSVTPLSTEYIFENDAITARICFTTPLLPHRVDIMARPVSYVEYEITDKTQSGKPVFFTFAMSSEICVNDRHAKVRFEKTARSLRVGNIEQKPFSCCGEGIMANWGYLQLCGGEVFACDSVELSRSGNPELIDTDKDYIASCDKPYLAVKAEGASGHITVGYDEVYPIEYFGEPLEESYKKQFSTFEEMLYSSHREYGTIRKMCLEFEEDFKEKVHPYGEDYCNLLSLSFRQAIGAHKFVYDKDGNSLFLSFECYSAGCVATLDVTYPSMPLFLLYNPELVLGMLRPIMKYAESDKWKFDFTPHDVGWYPIVGEQVYGNNELKFQMPVEEIGNMLLCIAACEKYSGGNKAFYEEFKDTLKKWADYLVKFGYDPGEQLCTDDFGGHLGHNCNLSIKAILGLAAYASLSGEKTYMEKAKKFAEMWERDAKNEQGTRLAFDMEDTWSIKYNMVWDSLLGYNLFSDDVKKREVELYKSKANRYGVPLDCRKNYAKCDWMMWSTVLWDDREYFDTVCTSLVRLVSETSDRVPLSDWFDTKTALCYSFRNRTVVGGLFINLLK